MTRSACILVEVDLLPCPYYGLRFIFFFEKRNKMFVDDIAVVCSDQISGVIFVVRRTLSVFSGPEVITFPPQTHCRGL